MAEHLVGHGTLPIALVHVSMHCMGKDLATMHASLAAESLQDSRMLAQSNAPIWVQLFATPK